MLLEVPCKKIFRTFTKYYYSCRVMYNQVDFQKQTFMITTDKPTIQPFHIEGIKHVDVNTAFEEIEQQRAIIVDVRETEEYSFESIPIVGVLNYPLSGILVMLEHVPHDKPIFVISERGERSAKAVNLFKRNGIPDTYNIDGGIKAWKIAGLPVEDILPEACSHCSKSEHPECGGCC